jgi:hypothetical protein
MSEREDRLRSLLDKVRAKRPAERTTRAAEALERIRTASGTTAAASVPETAPPLPPTAVPAAVPSAFPAQTTPELVPEPPTTPGIDSPTRYSSQPPEVERPLSVQPSSERVRPSSGSVPAASGSRRPEPIRPQSVAPTGQPVVYATEPPEFPRAKSFGELLELTLSLRPR